MRPITFYIRSRNMTPHIDESGGVHVCISEWDRYLIKSDNNRANGWRLDRSSVEALQAAQDR